MGECLGLGQAAQWGRAAAMVVHGRGRLQYGLGQAHVAHSLDTLVLTKRVDLKCSRHTICAQTMCVGNAQMLLLAVNHTQVSGWEIQDR